MKLDLSNKTVLITGGSRGIGASCVKLFSEAGANVSFTYIRAKERADELVEQYGPNVKAYKVDMQLEDELNNWVKQTVEDFGSADILVHNAGIWNDGELEKMTLEHWRELLRINLDSMFILTKAVAPYMKKNNWGRVIHVSSTAGQRGEAFHSHYAASKGGMISFTKSMASELGPYGITTNSVAPGWVDTEMNTEVFADKENKEQIREDIPVGRIATADDIAYPILFLATDWARHINGEILNVNGGSVLVG